MANHGPCAIYMDNNNTSPHTKGTGHKRPFFDQSKNSNDHQSRPPKRVRRVVDAATTCVPEQLHCRYANKKCLNLRAIKRTGGLHTFCAVHRANANRNQRRLDMRKRMARQAMQAQDQAMQAQDQALSMPKSVDKGQQGMETPLSSIDLDDARFDPLHAPTPLHEDDVSTLVSLFLPQQAPACEIQSDVPLTSTTFHDQASTPSTSGTSRPSTP